MDLLPVFSPRHYKVPVNSTFHKTILVNYFLHLKQFIKALVNRESWELPFNDVRKPYKCSYIIKPNWLKDFFRTNYRKACFFIFPQFRLSL